MAKLTVAHQEEIPTLPDDSILVLRVADVTVKQVDGNRGTWEKLECEFKILGIQATGDGSPVENYENLMGRSIWGSVPFRLTDSPENKLRLWAEAIFGMEIGVGFELDTDLFVNRECRGITSTYEKRTKDPRTGLPFKNHQVESLLPRGGGFVPAGAQPTAPSQAQAPAQGQFINPTGQTPVAAGSGNNWDPPF